jgi:hypothetical protein
LSSENIVAHASHKVLMEVDDNILLMIGNWQGILDQHQQLNHS